MARKPRIIAALLLFITLIGIIGQTIWTHYRLKYRPLQVYFPQFTRTHSGIQGDPVNILIVGTKSEITHAFLAAHWTIPDRITEKTSLKIGLDAVANRPYRTAPVSNLYLYNRRQDIAFEKPGATVRTRGHIRLWQSTESLDGTPIWVGSATYDSGIELSKTTHMPTHHIDPNVDGERTEVVDNLLPYVRTHTIVPFNTPIVNGHNGGGDYYFTDGRIAILAFTNVSDEDILQKLR